MADQPARPASDDWTVQVTGRIESVVSTVRDKTTVPITKVARFVVFGLLVGTMAAAALVLFVIALVRLNVYWPFGPEGRRVEVTYGVLGAIFVLVGAFLWRKRTAKTS